MLSAEELALYLALEQALISHGLQTSLKITAQREEGRKEPSGLPGVTPASERKHLADSLDQKPQRSLQISPAPSSPKKGRGRLPRSPAQEINRLHAELLEIPKRTIEKAIRVGELLTQQKAKLQHGAWLPWLKENVDFGHAIASRYARLYERREEISHCEKFSDAYRLLAGDAETALEADPESVKWSVPQVATNQEAETSSDQPSPEFAQDSAEETAEEPEHAVFKSRRISASLSDPGFYIQRDCDRFVKRLCKTIQERAQTQEERQELFACALKEFEQLPAMLEKSFSSLTSETASGATETVP